MTNIKHNIKNLIIAAAAIILSNITAYGTIFAAVTAPFSAAAAAYLTYTCGIGAGILIGLAAGIFNAFVFVSMNIFGIGCLCGALFAVIPGIVCGIAFLKKSCARNGIFAVTFSVVVFPLLYLAYVKYAVNFNISEFFGTTVTQTLNKYFLRIKSIYPDAVQNLSGNETEIFSLLGIYIPGLVPCFLILLSFIYSAFIYWLALAACRRSMISNSFFIQGLDSFFMPRITAVMLLLSMIIMFLDTDNITYMLFLNVIIIIFMMYAFEGLSFIEYKLKQKNYTFFLRVLLIFGFLIASTVISTLVPILNAFFVLAFIGMTDSAQNLRKNGFNKGEFNEK